MKIPGTILALSPHPDDSELGCGGTLAKYVEEGRKVYCAMFSLCRKSLREGLHPDTLELECESAMNQLGIKRENLFFFDYEVRNFDQYRQAILEQLVLLNKNLKPDMVFIPSVNDIHQDHQVIHKEALRAFKYSTVLGYELPWNVKNFTTAYFSTLSAAQVDKKVYAIKAYQSQSHRTYMNEEFILSLAKVRGIQCNHEYAEAFEVYKIIH